MQPNFSTNSNFINNEMGRRKLPLLPPQYTPSTTTAALSISNTNIPITSTLFSGLPSFSLVKYSQLDHLSTNLYSTLNGKNETSSFAAAIFVNDKVGNIKFDSNNIASSKLILNDSLKNLSSSQLRSNLTNSLSFLRVPFSTGIATSINSHVISSQRQNYLSTISNRNTQSIIQNDQQQPTIIPGATFKKVPYSSNFVSSFPAFENKQVNQCSLVNTILKKPRQKTVSSLIGNKASTETLSQLAFKKELRDTLSKIRSSSLEACEIEANHRHHVINRMINTGILPDVLRRRQIEINSQIPNVIKCTLPFDLIKNVKIVPPRLPSYNVLKKTEIFKSQNNKNIENISNDNKSKNKTTYDNFNAQNLQQISKSNYQNCQYSTKQVLAEKRSIGCQCNLTQKNNTSIQSQKLSTFSQYVIPSTSLKMQLKLEREMQEKNSKMVDSETQTIKILEVQTDKHMLNNSNDLFKQSLHLLNIKYSPSKNSKKVKKMLKNQNRFKFTKSDNHYDIELKQRQLQFELEQRRHEKNISMIDLRYLQELDSENLIQNNSNRLLSNKNNQLYNSSPHINQQYQSQILFDRNVEISKNKQNNIQNKNNYNYGSLPRNYERLLGENLHFCQHNNQNYCNRNHYQKQNSFSSIPNHLEYSLSMQNLNDYNNLQFYTPNICNNGKKQLNRHSRPYKSTSNIDKFNSTVDDMYLKQKLGQTNMFEEIRPNMLSQYANYLNNQFLLNQSDDPFTNKNQLNDNQSTYVFSGNYNNHMLPASGLTHLTAIQNNHVPLSFEEQQQSIPLVTPFNYELDDSYLLESQQVIPSQNSVYSRYESNYGQRPPAMCMRDYGNYLHNQAQSLQQLDNLQNFINYNYSNQRYDPNTMYSTYQKPIKFPINSTIINNYQTMPNLTKLKPKHNYLCCPQQNFNETQHIPRQVQHLNYRLNNSYQFPPGISYLPKNLNRKVKTFYPENYNNKDDGLSRIMQQYSRNSSANFQKSNLLPDSGKII